MLDFVVDLPISGITPHLAQNRSRSGGTAIGGRTARHQGYTQPFKARKGSEQVFGWIKQLAACATQGQRQIKGGSGVPVACGGLQPDPNHQPTQVTGGDGMKVSI